MQETVKTVEKRLDGRTGDEEVPDRPLVSAPSAKKQIWLGLSDEELEERREHCEEVYIACPPLFWT